MGSVAQSREGRRIALAREATRFSLLWGVVFGLAMALSVAIAMDGDPAPGDLRLTREVQDLPAFHSIAEAFRWGMGTEGVLTVGIPLAVALWLTGWRREGVVLAGSLLVLRVMQPVIKNIVDRDRPSEDLVDRRAGFGSESFPSGHMMSSFVLCGVLVAITWRLPLARPGKIAITAALAVVLLLNGTSSVYMGVHWPTDVLGGILWGLVIVIPAAAAVLLPHHPPATRAPAPPPGSAGSSSADTR